MASPKDFDLQLVEPTDVEPPDAGGWLQLNKCKKWHPILLLVINNALQYETPQKILSKKVLLTLFHLSRVSVFPKEEC